MVIIMLIQDTRVSTLIYSCLDLTVGMEGMVGIGVEIAEKNSKSVTVGITSHQYI